MMSVAFGTLRHDGAQILADRIAVRLKPDTTPAVRLKPDWTTEKSRRKRWRYSGHAIEVAFFRCPGHGVTIDNGADVAGAQDAARENSLLASRPLSRSPPHRSSPRSAAAPVEQRMDGALQRCQAFGALTGSVRTLD